jgi:glycosyltransferase involved in cell wall biosynthesis
MLKVLHLNYSGRFSGAAIAALRLNRALNRAGISSELLSQRDPSPESGVSVIANGFFGRKYSGGKNILVQKAARFLSGGESCSYNLFPSGLAKRLNASDADVIHLHWVNAEMISVAELAKIKKPVVWTLHDMWPFCGAEHYTDDNRYVTGYQSSEFRVQSSEPKANGLKSKAFFDLDRWVFRRKQRLWKNWRPHIVTPSNWLANCSRQSVLFKDLSVDVIPNCLDLEVFKPMDQAECRHTLGLPLDKKLILFGAFNPADTRKGGDLLKLALQKLDLPDIELVVFGASDGPQIAGLATHWLGSFSKESDLALLYNAADLMAAPSRQDNLPNTVAEALSCGTPVVAFNIGGLPDMVDHKKNGWLAQPFVTMEFAEGISVVLSEGFRNACREKAVSMFLPARVTELYKNIYEQSLF